MKFGFGYGYAPHTAARELWEVASDAGFDQAWSSDSHVLWHECFSLMGWLIGEVKPDFEFGTCVTNPITRDPMVTASAFATLNRITDGRMICGIGRGDSAVRLLNRKPSRLAALEEAVETIRTLGSGRPLAHDGDEVRLSWASGELPVYVAGYGPKALRLAGRAGSGVIFQIADPYVIEWSLQHVRAGAEEAGRDPDALTLHCVAPSFVSADRDEARERCRWFPAVVGNHVADVLRHHAAEDLPADLISYVEGRQAYDYREHATAGTDHSGYVPDEIVDRFCILGTADECAAKIRALERLGVGELNILPAVGDDRILETIETYGKEIAPRFRAP